MLEIGSLPDHRPLVEMLFFLNNCLILAFLLLRKWGYVVACVRDFDYVPSSFHFFLLSQVLAKSSWQFILGPWRNKAVPGWGSRWISWICSYWRANCQSSNHGTSSWGHDCSSGCYTETTGENSDHCSSSTSVKSQPKSVVELWSILVKIKKNYNLEFVKRR